MSRPKHYPDILAGKKQLGPYPMEKLKRVDKPTTRIVGDIQRFNEREHGFNKAYRGDFGNLKVKDASLRALKDPLFSSFSTMLWNLPPVDAGVPIKLPRMLYIKDRDKIAPMPEYGTTAGQLMLDTAPQKAAIPDDPAVMNRHIKSLGYFLGADVMGICELPEWALYSYDEEARPVETDHTHAICIVVDMDYRTVNGSTGYDWIGGSAPQMSYLYSAFIATLIAGYIRKLGYRARVQHAQNYQVAITPLLLMSGIGEVSRAGIVLNPFIGMRFKAAAVTTDLPLEPDKPVDFGLQDFCDKCKKCAVECPSKSIPMGDKVLYNGYETWRFNMESCTRMRVGNPNGMGCGHCINVCPWNKPEGWTHDLVRWMIAHMPLTNRFIVKMDDVLGYGKPDTGDRWQLDF
jgi:reductive dehalogenase